MTNSAVHPFDLEDQRQEAIETARQLHELTLSDEELECWNWALSPGSGFEGEAIGWFFPEVK